MTGEIAQSGPDHPFLLVSILNGPANFASSARKASGKIMNRMRTRNRERSTRIQPHQRVILRDVGIFMAKLWIDSIKGVALTFVSLGAAAIDYVRGPREGGLLFYRVLRWSEQFDLWLNLYGAADGADQNEEGLFGVSRSGADTFLGKLEELTGGERERRSTATVESDPPTSQST
jgi:hypothetical protein